MGKKHNLSVQEFSMIPLQTGIQIETPDGIGEYEGITSSGLVTVTIQGGLMIYTWSDIYPLVTMDNICLMEVILSSLKLQVVAGGKK